jgi:hypothetical protein
MFCAADLDVWDRHIPGMRHSAMSARSRGLRYERGGGVMQEHNIRSRPLAEAEDCRPSALGLPVTGVKPGADSGDANLSNVTEYPLY